MSQITSRKIPLGSPIFPHRHRLSAEEIAKIEAEDKALARRCREIFNRVYPQLAGEYYNWFIVIEPESGDYFIDSEEKVAFQKAKQQHPQAVLLAMRLNETGACGRI